MKGTAVKASAVKEGSRSEARAQHLGTKKTKIGDKKNKKWGRKNYAADLGTKKTFGDKKHIWGQKKTSPVDTVIGQLTCRRKWEAY